MTSLTRTARTTGLLYLGLAVTGMLGFILIRPTLFSADDPGATAARLADNEALARISIALEIGIVLTQALAAIWFYKLYSSARPVAAASIAAFGLVNAVAIMGSTAATSTALAVALNPVLAPAGDAAARSGAVLHTQRFILGRRQPVLRTVADPDGGSGPRLLGGRRSCWAGR